MSRLIHTLFVALLLCHLGYATERPNILIVLVDDMGFSDIGCDGGEIKECTEMDYAAYKAKLESDKAANMDQKISP